MATSARAAVLWNVKRKTTIYKTIKRGSLYCLLGPDKCPERRPASWLPDFNHWLWTPKSERGNLTFGDERQDRKVITVSQLHAYCFSPHPRNMPRVAYWY
jgi:hypothetical protein